MGGEQGVGLPQHSLGVSGRGGVHGPAQADRDGAQRTHVGVGHPVGPPGFLAQRGPQIVDPVELGIGQPQRDGQVTGIIHSWPSRLP